MADEHDEETQLLEPIEPAQLLKNLELTTGKAAEFAGVSRRQLCYWTDTGIVSAVEGGGGDDDGDGDSSARRTYDFDALHRVLLVKRTLEHSAGLRRAAREVDQHITERHRKAKELGDSIEQNRDEFLTEQADKLEAIAARIQQLLPELKDREQVAELYQALEWLDRLAERVQAGEILLEEDAEACLRLASRTDQAEAKLESMAASD